MEERSCELKYSATIDCNPENSSSTLDSSSFRRKSTDHQPCPDGIPFRQIIKDPILHTHTHTHTHTHIHTYLDTQRADTKVQSNCWQRQCRRYCLSLIQVGAGGDILHFPYCLSFFRLFFFFFFIIIRKICSFLLISFTFSYLTLIIY